MPSVDASKFRAIENYDQPRDGLFQIITESWWIVNEDGRPLVYSMANSPQCNSNRSIAERIANGRPLKQIPIVYLPVRPSDFA